MPRSFVAWVASVAAALLASLALADPPQLVLAVEDAAAPWSYADGSGYANDLVRAVFKEAGWSLRLDVMPYSRCKAKAMAGQVAGCFSASRLPEMEATLMYPTAPLFNARNVLVVRTGSPWHDCRLAGLDHVPVVGLVRGYEYLPAVEELTSGGAARAEWADSEALNLRKLRAGRLDAAMVTVDEVKRLDLVLQLARLPKDFRTVCDYGALPAYVAFSRAHPQGGAALAAYDAAYARLHRRGAVAALQAQWRDRAMAASTARER